MFKNKLQQYFIAGLLVWLPLLITVWVLLWSLGLLDSIFGAMLRGLEAVFPSLAGTAEQFMTVPGVGVVALGLLIFSTGVFAANMVGQWWLRKWDQLFTRIPVVRNIYSSVKQVSDTLFSGSSKAFSKALLVQYPRQGVWTVAFLTGTPSGEVNQHLQGDFVSVYVPTTPNPTSGFFLMMPRSEVIELHISVDEALKYIISMGVVAPSAAAVHGTAAQPADSTPQSEQETPPPS